MKSHLTKVSLALLSTVFLFGCQEQGSGPVGPGPEFHHRDGHSKGGPGGPGTFPVDVTVTDGIEAATQKMRFGENDELMGWTRRPDQPAPGGFLFQMNMTNTLAFALLGNCLEEGKRIEAAQASGFVVNLFNKLVQPSPDNPLPLTEAGAFLVAVDKAALGDPSIDHNMSIDNNIDGVPAEERWNMKVRGEPTVTVVGGDGTVDGDFTVRFSGGTIRLNGSPTGKTPDQVFLTCDIQDGDEIAFTVVRPS